uniref:exo-alpha-sialidase n=1 Tax=Pelusios castaneus TaxID=367368 RepID=A0A8C8S145_9SAUR
MTQASVTSEKVTLFPQDPQSRLTYRIPALLFIPPDTFLAFAEERSSPRDEDAKILVLRRGTKKENTVEWGPMEPLTSATKDGYRTMSPCPVYERESQTVFLFFNCVEGTVSEQEQIKTGKNAARLCYVCSTDAGQTWCSLTDLTEQVIGKDLKNWATFAVGPGHGVQLNSGRLVIPAYAYHITARRCELIQEECQVAEVMHQEGDVQYSVYCNARTPHGLRAEALSTDEGLTFRSPSLQEELCETGTGCQGSVVSYTPTPGHGKTASSWLLYSHPADKQEDIEKLCH